MGIDENTDGGEKGREREGSRGESGKSLARTRDAYEEGVVYASLYAPIVIGAGRLCHLARSSLSRIWVLCCLCFPLHHSTVGKYSLPSTDDDSGESLSPLWPRGLLRHRVFVDPRSVHLHPVTTLVDASAAREPALP